MVWPEPGGEEQLTVDLFFSRSSIHGQPVSVFRPPTRFKIVRVESANPYSYASNHISATQCVYTYTHTQATRHVEAKRPRTQCNAGGFALLCCARVA